MHSLLFLLHILELYSLLHKYEKKIVFLPNTIIEATSMFLLDTIEWQLPNTSISFKTVNDQRHELHVTV